MNLYNEFKKMVRESYSQISKNSDHHFKNRSVEGYVEMRERIFNTNKKQKLEKQHAINDPKRIEGLISKIELIHKIKNNKRTSSYDTIHSINNSIISKLNKNDYNNNEVSPIFNDDYVNKVEDVKDKSIFIERVKLIQEKTQDKIKHKKKNLSNVINLLYNPNYECIHQQAPKYSFSTSAKMKEIKNIIYQNVCSKYNQHEKKHKMIKLNKKLKGISFRVGYNNKDKDCYKDNKTKKYVCQSTVIHNTKNYGTSNSNGENVKDNGKNKNLFTICSKRRRKFKLKPLNESCSMD